MPFRPLFVLLMLACMALPAAAEPASAPRQLRSFDEIRDWQAVGRLDIGPRTCTGALVTRRHVVTSAHCVMFGGRVVPADAVRFSLGLRNGVFLVTATAAGVAVPGEYVEIEPEAGLEAYYRARTFDLALITLPAPVVELSVRPFAIGTGTRDGLTVSVLSYGRGRNEAPSLQDRCQVLEHRAGAPIMDCDATYGSSGAPVFVTRGDERLLVSVVSGGQQEGGRLQTIGAARMDWLRARLATQSEPGRESRPAGAAPLSRQLGRAPSAGLPQIGR